MPADELRYALALREVVHGAQRSVPWVRDELERLATEYVGAYEVQPDALQEQLGELNLTDPSSMASLSQLGDPSALLGAMRSDRQGPLLESLQRFVSVLEGYTDIVVEMLGEKMMTSHARIDEALKRHRLDRGEAAAFVDRLLGLELDRGHYDDGIAFSRGVVERGGIEQLNRLWTGLGDDADPRRARGARPLARPHRPLVGRQNQVSVAGSGDVANIASARATAPGRVLVDLAGSRERRPRVPAEQHRAERRARRTTDRVRRSSTLAAARAVGTAVEREP